MLNVGILNEADFEKLPNGYKVEAEPEVKEQATESKPAPKKPTAKKTNKK